MHTLIRIILVFVALMVTVARADSESKDEWPREYSAEDTLFTVYQPQLESWDGEFLKARSAVAVRLPGEKQNKFGVLLLSASTDVDKPNRTVYLSDLELIEFEFPADEAQAAPILERLKKIVPKKTKTISLDRLETGMAILKEHEKVAKLDVKNTPPTIIFSDTPAILIRVGGGLRLQKVEGTELDRVINTRVLLLKDKNGLYYLHLYDGFVRAPELNAVWTSLEKPSKDLEQAEKLSVKKKQADMLAGNRDPKSGKLPSLKSNSIPRIFVATSPTELLITEGAPKWSPITDTELLFITNTSANIFRHIKDQRVYVLISGRWFGAPAMEGPWTYVAAKDLPPDFAKIPDDSPKENVKASVLETRQANESAISNTIPQSTRVSRTKAKMSPEPTYDGEPKLDAIPGVDLDYVVNSATPVLKVHSHSSWYACQNGVWFFAPSSRGPWTVATNVPADIYAIPPSCPVHYVAYVRILGFDAEYVWFAVTPGYGGTAVNSEGLIVYGTGYEYEPYIGTTEYVAYPETYGYNSCPTWTPWAGWCYGFAACWAWNASWDYWCCSPCAPYWGCYYGACYGFGYNAYGGVAAWGPYGWAGTSGYIYSNNGPWSGVGRVSGGYNAMTGNQWASRYGHAYNSSTGSMVAGRQGAIGNVYSGNYAYGGRGIAQSGQTGITAIGGRGTIGNVNTGNQISGGRAAIYNPNTGNVNHISGIRGDSGGAIKVNGDVIAGRDGNVYKRTDGNWSPVSTPTPSARTSTPARRADYSHLNSQRATQYNGSVRQQSYSSHRPSVSRGGGGSYRGGGGRGGGGRRK